MAKLPRVTNKLYASEIELEDIGQFGSAATGEKLNTKDIPTIQGNAAWEKGWSHATMSESGYPTRQERNGMDYSFSYQIDYLLREGVAEYDAETEYNKGSVVKMIEEGVVNFYISIIDNNIGFELNNSQAWIKWVPNSDILVTHPKSTAVGNATTPVYVNSSGVATSTGYSIANSRFDGQWVSSTKTLSTATAVGTYTIDLSSYLPNDNYNYEVFITGKIGRTASGSTPCTIYSDINSTSHYIAFVGSDTTNSTFAFSIPVKKYLYYQIGDGSNRPVANSLIIAVRYRRIGTNT